jgi:hypothetical protein
MTTPMPLLFQTRSDFHLAFIQFLDSDDALFRQKFDEGIEKRIGFKDAVGVGIGAAVGKEQTTDEFVAEVFQKFC